MDYFYPCLGTLSNSTTANFLHHFWTIDSIPVRRRCIGSIASLRVAARGCEPFDEHIFQMGWKAITWNNTENPSDMISFRI